ncbi:hypothetical protein M5K25_002677 [Dendrobium thyrsiflorum]|uniref:VQ domain-containing protein n=1 Tax=Dendrobium thyrsiflorum TaxID=117978 RepID=A0ABD0VVS4_DENTH
MGFSGGSPSGITFLQSSGGSSSWVTFLHSSGGYSLLRLPNSMDLFLQPTGKPSLRRKNQLHGPRPSPLKLHKDSHKIIKPPIIIYTVSPKVIHTNPNEFMSLVQRLTGFSSTATDTKASSSSSSSTDSHIVALKPENDAEAIELSSPNLFSPSVMDFMNSNLFHHELLSPSYHDNKGSFVESAFLASPGSFFCSL